MDKIYFKANQGRCFIQLTHGCAGQHEAAPDDAQVPGRSWL